MMPQSEPCRATIVIPTFRRPKMLESALLSCLAQEPGSLAGCDILVVDNAPEASARAAVEARAGQAAVPVRYLHVAVPGIARARNAGVAAAQGKFVVFLDDDQEAASSHWLGAFLGLAERGAKAAFGPIQPAFDARGDGVPPGAARMFRRELSADDGDDISRLRAFLGSGNSVFEKASCFNSATPFPTELDGLGGEDSEFIAGLAARGIPLTWAAKALVREHVPSDRMTLKSLAQRSFRNGQIRSLIQSRSKEGSAAKVALWMGVGMGQAALYGAGSLAMAALDPKVSADLRIRAWGGVGKVLWTRRFWQISYPAGAAAKT